MRGTLATTSTRNITRHRCGRAWRNTDTSRDERLITSQTPPPHGGVKSDHFCHAPVTHLSDVINATPAIRRRKRVGFEKKRAVLHRYRILAPSFIPTCAGC